MSTFVLVHDAFRGAWAWSRVRPLLERRGHAVFTPTLSGVGERRHLLGPLGTSLTLGTWVADVGNVLQYGDLHDVVLVGHGQGGVVATAVSERCAARLAHLVYLDAPVPEDGQAAADLTPRAAQPWKRPARGTVVEPRPLEPGGGLDSADITWINQRLSPEPAGPAFDPVVLRDPAALAIPRTYAFCAATTAADPAVLMRARLDASATPYHLLDCGHDAPLAAPGAVADLLAGVASASR